MTDNIAFQADPPITFVPSNNDAAVIQTGEQGPPGPAPWAIPATAWATGNNYTATAPASTVTFNGTLYACIVTHTSGAAFDPSKWQAITGVSVGNIDDGTFTAPVTTIQLLRSTTSGLAPSSLADGQIAINEADRKLFYLNPSAAIEFFTLFDARQSPNLVINGGMEVDQVNVGNAQTGITNVTVYGVDQFRFSGTAGITVTTQQVSDAPAGFTKSLKVSVTTAKSSLATTDFAVINTPIEGLRCERLAFGTAGALTVSVGFYVKANRTGQYSGSIGNGANNRSYQFSFTIASSGVWQYVTAVIPGDITGTWATDNTVGLTLGVTMAAGTSLLGTANMWSGNLFVGATGQINGVAATSDYFQITGVSMIPSTMAVPQWLAPQFVPPFQETLTLCQRHYEKSYDYTVAPGAINSSGAVRFGTSGLTNQQNTLYIGINFKVRKRTSAGVTVSSYSTASGAGSKIRDEVNNSDITPTLSYFGETNGTYAAQSSASTGSPLFSFHWTIDARL